MGNGIMRRDDYAAVLGVNNRSALSSSARRGLARAAALEYAVQDYRASLAHRKMYDVAEATVAAVGYVGVMVRAGDAETAMNPAAAPYVQQIVAVGAMGLAHIVADTAS